jgi:transposase-like protein
MKKRMLGRGERNLKAKLTETDVLEIVRLYGAGKTKAEIARQFGVTQPTIYFILNGTSWSYLTGIKKGG